MQEKEVKGKVIQILTEQLDIERDKCRGEARLIEDLGADDLDVVEIMMDLESEFGIEIEYEDAEEFKTVADVVKYMVGVVE